MAHYLEHLQLEIIEEVGEDTTNSQYLKIVEVTEVIDENGDDFFTKLINN